MRETQNDPVIDEIREVRHRISARFGHDPERLVAYYMELQKQYGDRLIRAEESAPRFLARVEAARQSLLDERGVPLEQVP